MLEELCVFIQKKKSNCGQKKMKKSSERNSLFRSGNKQDLLGSKGEKSSDSTNLAEEEKREFSEEKEEASSGTDDRVAELELEMANLKDQALRAMAEAENVKKRAEREVAAAKIYGVEKFATDVLSVVDNLGRALMTLDGKAKDDLGDNAKNLLEGIELTEKNLMAVLARHGIKAVREDGDEATSNSAVQQRTAQVAHCRAAIDAPFAASGEGRVHQDNAGA